ncbi:MAG: 50S ribosomal protein L25 [Candidatus Dormibacterales bacterium]
MPLRLKAENREARGKALRHLRSEGKLPAVVYGHRAEAAALMLDGHEFQRVYARAGRTHLVDLQVDGGRAQKVLVREVQHHPRRPGPIHVDLYRVDLKEKLHAEVPLVLVGESPAVKLGDGDAIQGIHVLRIECLPSDIPDAIEVDISSLESAESVLRVSELRVVEGLTVLSDPEDVVVRIAARRELAAEAEGEAVAAAEGAEAAPAEAAAAPEEGGARPAAASRQEDTE